MKQASSGRTEPGVTERMRDAARQKADRNAHSWESRTLLVKTELAAASAANDEKTARLRALRLEKERQEAKTAPAAAPAPAAGRAKPRTVRRIVVN